MYNTDNYNNFAYPPSQYLLQQAYPNIIETPVNNRLTSPQVVAVPAAAPNSIVTPPSPTVVLSNSV